jgi:hypothetical protein
VQERADILAAMVSKYAFLVPVTLVFTLLGCEGGSVGDESAGSSESGETTDDPSATNPTTSPTTTEPTSTTEPSTTMTTEDTEDPDTTDTDPSTTGPGGCPQDIEFGDPDTASCGPLDSDFTPEASPDYGACVSDGGEWVLVDEPPGSAARVVAYEDMMELLRGGDTPTADDFLMARAIYATKNGLESRVLRREDLHYPPIPIEDQDMTVAFDRQCTVNENATNYPDRCVGPGLIQPLLDEAFAAGMSGDGDPNVHAARIDAGVQWFLWVSIYKESASCIQAPGDCDSHWAYYNGGTEQGQAIGIAADLYAIDPAIDTAVFNGMLAIRCWRDLFPADGDPLFEDLSPEALAMFYEAHEQLDNAAWYAWARQVRNHLEQQPAVCDSAADANWAFIQVAGPILDLEAEVRDADAAATLAALWANDTPTVEDLQAGIDAIDVAFPCPQCPDCDVPEEWGY